MSPQLAGGGGELGGGSASSDSSGLSEDERVEGDSVEDAGSHPARANSNNHVQDDRRMRILPLERRALGLFARGLAILAPCTRQSAVGTHARLPARTHAFCALRKRLMCGRCAKSRAQS